MDIAGILRLYRTVTEMTIKEIEVKSGLSRYMISAVESGNKPIRDNHVRRLTQAYRANYNNIITIAQKSEKEEWRYDTVLYYCLETWLNQNDCHMVKDEQISFEKALARVFKALRVVNNMSRAEVAQNLGCTIFCLYDVESGNNVPPLKRVRELATFYKLRISEVFRIQEDCIKNQWNFQKVLFEVLCAWEKEN